MSRPLLVLLTPLVGLALAACATTPPVPPVASVPVSPSPSSRSAVPSATPTVTPSSTPTATATPTPTPTEDQGANLVLRGDGLGPYDFGAKQQPVLELLVDQLGEPDESYQGILCELDDTSPWAQTNSYGGLWVQFNAKDRSKKSARTLAAWGFQLSKKFAEPLELADDVPLNLSFAQLKAKYPKGKLQDLGLGDGTKSFLLPNKMRFVGAGKPATVQAGHFSLCE